MLKAVKVEKEPFDRALLKIINAKPVPKDSLPKLKKKLAQIIELARA